MDDEVQIPCDFDRTVQTIKEINVKYLVVYFKVEVNNEQIRTYE